MELLGKIKKRWQVMLILTMIIVMGITACSNSNDGDGKNDTEQGVDNNLGNNGDNNASGDKNGGKNIDKHISEKYDLPEDNQANHGQFKVMETELGYYYNIGLLNTVYNEKGQNVAIRTNLMNMFFFDKESQIAVHLCDKPECRHQQTDYFVTIEKDKVVVYSAKQGNFGEKLGELAYEQDTGNLILQKDEFKICNDRIYRAYTKPFPDTPEEQEKLTHAEMGTYILNGRFYQSCAIADILSGKGEWSETFRTLNEE